MRILLDTNILLRSAEPSHAQHKLADDAMAALVKRGDTLLLVPQVFYEYWVVATRPLEQNGLGFTTSLARSELDQLEMLFAMLPDTDTVYSRWKDLVVQHDVKGKPAHDARLVAAMTVHDIEAVLTFNPNDFMRFKGINVLTPQGIIRP